MSTEGSLTSAVKTLGLEIQIMAALAAYARDAGSDTAIEEHQANRVSDAFDVVQEHLVALLARAVD